MAHEVAAYERSEGIAISLVWRAEVWPAQVTWWTVAYEKMVKKEKKQRHAYTFSSTWAGELINNLLTISKRDLTMMAVSGPALLLWWVEDGRERHAVHRLDVHC